jgi:hypothetical protein
MDNVEFINIGKDRTKTEMRLLQKIEFGKEVIPFEFFKKNEVTETEIEVLNVYQLDNNTRFTVIKDKLLKIPAEHSIYNYIDIGRKVLVNERYTYKNPNHEEILYLFNDLDICERNLKLFDDFDNKREMNLKKIGVLNNWHCYLVFKEDIDQVKNLIKAQKEEERLEKEKENAEDLEQKQKKAELEKYLKTVTKDTLLEDKDIIICNNYLIDKERGIKIEFKKPICEMYKNDIIIRSYIETDNFLQLEYSDIMNELENLFETGKYQDTIENKLKEFNKTYKKYLLDFKIYSYNRETKEEKFIKEVKFTVDNGKTGKEHYYINDIQIPKQKIKFLIRFLRGSDRTGWSGDIHTNTLINRYSELEQNIENFKYYTGKQLDLLEGKDFTVYYKEKEIELHFEIKNPTRKIDNWQVKFGDLVLEKTYAQVKQMYSSYNHKSEHIAGQISSICESLSAVELEDKIIKHLNLVLEKIKQAEIKAKTLFTDFIEKNKTKIIPKDNFYLVKGKLKTYKLGIEKNEAKVWTYPNNNYVCINESDKEGHNLCIWDKLLQFAMALINDSKIREEISTLN